LQPSSSSNSAVARIDLFFAGMFLHSVIVQAVMEAGSHCAQPLSISRFLSTVPCINLTQVPAGAT
jgi:hypothetical protein